MTDIEKAAAEAELKDKDLDKVAGGKLRPSDPSPGRKNLPQYSWEEYVRAGITPTVTDFSYYFVYQGQRISEREANRIVEEKNGMFGNLETLYLTI